MALPSITAAESVIMQALWARGPLGAEEIVAETAPARGWGEATVRTLIARLARKQALRSERRRGRTVYAPLVARDDYLTAESQGLLDRWFGGQLGALVAHLARQRSLSDEEVGRLRRLVAELDREP